MSSTIVTAGMESIGPEKAAHYLTKNTHNRNKKTTKIANYARDMLAGKWLPTGEAIKFDITGRLIDGQNRLFAIIESGCTVEIMVVRNLPTDAMVVMDSGAPRRAADALKLTGYGNGKDLAATANTHRSWKSGLIKRTNTEIASGSRMTNSEVVEYVTNHPELEEACAFAVKAKRSLQLPVGSIATAYDEFVTINPDDAVDFFNRIEGMRTNGYGDPIFMLIRRVNDERNSGNRVKTSHALYYLFRSWNAYREGKTLSKYLLGSKESGWSTIPDPK